ncbi:MAG: hypothetical protein U1E85_06120 [Rhodocyclaceae bacterium]
MWQRGWRMLVLGASLAAAAGGAWASESPDNETVIMVGNVSYVSGGIGEDSRERMKAFSAAFNLKLLLAYKSGSYMSDVDVVVADAKGKPLIKASSEGPIFMARLPAGAYEVTATAVGQAQRQKVTVTNGRQAVLHFRWADPAE